MGRMRLRLIISATVAAVATYSAVMRDARRPAHGRRWDDADILADDPGLAPPVPDESRSSVFMAVPIEVSYLADEGDDLLPEPLPDVPSGSLFDGPMTRFSRGGVPPAPSRPIGYREPSAPAEGPSGSAAGPEASAEDVWDALRGPAASASESAVTASPEAPPEHEGDDEGDTSARESRFASLLPRDMRYDAGIDPTALTETEDVPATGEGDGEPTDGPAAVAAPESDEITPEAEASDGDAPVSESTSSPRADDQTTAAPDAEPVADDVPESATWVRTEAALPPNAPASVFETWIRPAITGAPADLSSDVADAAVFDAWVDSESTRTAPDTTTPVASGVVFDAWFGSESVEAPAADVSGEVDESASNVDVAPALDDVAVAVAGTHGGDDASVFDTWIRNTPTAPGGSLSGDASVFDTWVQPETSDSTEVDTGVFDTWIRTADDTPAAPDDSPAGDASVFDTWVQPETSESTEVDAGVFDAWFRPIAVDASSTQADDDSGESVGALGRLDAADLVRASAESVTQSRSSALPETTPVGLRPIPWRAIVDLRTPETPIETTPHEAPSIPVQEEAPVSEPAAVDTPRPEPVSRGFSAPRHGGRMTIDARVLQTGEFAIASTALVPGQGTITAVTFRTPIQDPVTAGDIELVLDEVVNVAPNGLHVLDSEGFAPNAEGFVLMLLAADAGDFSAHGSYQVRG